MKKIILFASLLFCVFHAQCQEVAVEKNLYGVQFGLLSLSFQYERALSRKVVLHLEGGAMMVVYTIDNNIAGEEYKTGYITAPFFSIEPRWYYGLDRRARLHRNTKNNSSNFVSLNIVYNALDWEITNSYKNYNVVPAIGVIPTYGIRRSFAKHFNYEFLFGIGYRHNIFGQSEDCHCTHDEVATDIQAKIGYNF